MSWIKSADVPLRMDSRPRYILGLPEDKKVAMSTLGRFLVHEGAGHGTYVHDLIHKSPVIGLEGIRNQAMIEDQAAFEARIHNLDNSTPVWFHDRIKIGGCSICKMDEINRRFPR